MLQLLLGGLAGLGVALRLYWGRVREFLGLRRGRDIGNQASGKASSRGDNVPGNRD